MDEIRIKHTMSRMQQLASTFEHRVAAIQAFRLELDRFIEALPGVNAFPEVQRLQELLEFLSNEENSTRGTLNALNRTLLERCDPEGNS